MKLTQELTQLLASFIKKVLQEQNTSITPVLEISLQDGDETKVFRSQDSIVTIGRSVMNEIELPDRFISREHAKIIKKHNKYFLLDLGSTNGTYLNRQVLEQNREHPLKDGDLIQMERFRMRVSIESAEQIAEKQIQIVTQSVTDELFRDFLKQVQPADALAIYEVTPNCHQTYFQLEAPVLLKLLGQKVFSTKPEHSKVWQKFENSLVELEYLINKAFSKQLGYTVNYLKLENPQDLISAPESKLTVLKIKIRIGEQSGFLRLGIPRRLFKSLLENISGHGTPPEPANLKARSSSGESDSSQEGNLLDPRPHTKNDKLSRLQQVHTTLHLELGTFTISSLEWMKLGIEQIILLKGMNCLDAAGNFSGEIRLRLPGDEKRFWIGVLQSSGGSYTIKIVKTIKTTSADTDVSGRMLFLNEENATYEPDEFGSESDQGSLNSPLVDEKISVDDKVSILKEINLLLKIELNRLKLKVADIINLKPGKIIQIKYPLSEKVTITMNQKSLARAKLFAHHRGVAVQISEILS